MRAHGVALSGPGCAVRCPEALEERPLFRASRRLGDKHKRRGVMKELGEGRCRWCMPGWKDESGNANSAGSVHQGREERLLKGKPEEGDKREPHKQDHFLTNQNPFFRLFLFFCAGVFLAHHRWRK